MNDLERRLIEDRALRDSALRLFRSDLQVIREDLRERPVSARISSRLGDAAMSGRYSLASRSECTGDDQRAGQR